MPMYEYQCCKCSARTIVLSRAYGDVSGVVCKKCGSDEMVRLVSSFAYHRSQNDRMADIDTSNPRGDDYYSDSRNVGLWAKKRVRELGADSETVQQIDRVVDSAAEKALSGKLLDDVGS